jgi:hypothetical protein
VTTAKTAIKKPPIATFFAAPLLELLPPDWFLVGATVLAVVGATVVESSIKQAHTSSGSVLPVSHQCFIPLGHVQHLASNSLVGMGVLVDPEDGELVLGEDEPEEGAGVLDS